MTPQDLRSRYRELSNHAYAIRAAAETEHRDLTEAEADDLDLTFGRLAALEREMELEDDPSAGRQTSPSAPGGRTGAPQVLGSRPTGERYFTSEGRPVAVYGPSERMAAGGLATEPFNLARATAAMWSGNWQFAERERRYMAQQGETLGAAGGFMVPEVVSREVIDLARAQSRAIQAGVRTLQMDSNIVHVARVANDPTVTWRPEHAVIPSSIVTFERVTLQAYTAGAIVVSSEELLQDAPNSDALFRRLLGEALGGAMDDAVFNGSGIGSEPEGLLTNSLGDIPVLPDVGKVTDYDWAVDAVTRIQRANGEATAVVYSPGLASVLGKLKTGITNDNTPLAPPAAWTELAKFVSNRVPEGSPDTMSAIFGGFNEVVIGLRLPLRLEIANSGGTYTDGSPDVDEQTGDSFSRYQLRIRAVMRMDVAVYRPNLLCIAPGLTP
jgi:HK97 family phage major capsid protein